MPTKPSGAPAKSILDKRRLKALGVLLPIRLHAMSSLPGRHPLGRAGEGMRFLRTRPYEAGHDNPRDIDKFSPEGEYWINEWESEAQAAIRIYADVSASMSVGATAALRNITLLQLTYSLWRASDRVRTVLYGLNSIEEIAEKNLKTQLDRLASRLGDNPVLEGEDAVATMSRLAVRPGSVKGDLVFIVSDFIAVRSTSKVKDTEAWKGIVRGLRCDIVPVIVSFELATSQRGAIKLWDSERKRQCLTLITPERARRINAEEAARVAALQKLFRSLGLDSMSVRREHDVYPALAALAGRRRKRRS